MIEVKILNPDFEKAILTLDDKTLELFVNEFKQTISRRAFG